MSLIPDVVKTLRNFRMCLFASRALPVQHSALRVTCALQVASCCRGLGVSALPYLG